MVLRRSAAAMAAALLSLPMAAPVAEARPASPAHAQAHPQAHPHAKAQSQPQSQVQAHGWRYVRAFRSLGACQNAGRRIVSRHKAHAYSCDNTYTPSGVPVLDLYVRR